MRILMLGGTRFIGAHISAALAARGDEVTVVHRGQHEPAMAAPGVAHIHADRAGFAAIAERTRALRPDAVIDTNAMTGADAMAVLPYLPDTALLVLSSMDVYRAYELLLAGQGGEAVPLTEQAPVRRGRYPLRGRTGGRDDYDKLDVEPLYLNRGATVLRLSAIYGEHDPQRREEFMLRRVRAGRRRIPVGPGTFLWTRGYAGDVASGALAALDNPSAAAGEVFNIGDLTTGTVRDHAQQILAIAGHDAELVTVPIPAMAVTLAIFAALQVAMPLWVRPNLAPADHVAIPVSWQGNFSPAQTGPGGSTFTLFAVTLPGQPGAWLLSSGPVNAAGQPVSATPAACASIANTGGVNTGSSQASQGGSGAPATGPAAFLACLGSRGIREAITYQPASRYWRFQATEA